MWSRIVAVVVSSLMVTGALPAQEEEPPAEPEPVEVTGEDVKRFINPTIIVNRIGYGFGYSALPGGDIMSNRVEARWAINLDNAVTIKVPIVRLKQDGRPAEWGISDIVFNYGSVIYEELNSRFTTAAVLLDVVAPTGDEERGLGLGKWIVAPGGAIALNPTDVFPVFVVGRYLHSVGGESDQPNIRSFEFEVDPFFILPYGFWLGGQAGFTVDSDFTVFSLGTFLGRALTRHFAWSVGYVEHMSGRETFARRFAVSLSWLE